jgi:hypothetical protein
VQGQLEHWTEHFIEVLNSEGSEADHTPLHSSPELQISTRPPSKKVILQAINKMKNGKAAGADIIPAEVLKVEPIVSADTLYTLFLNMWNEGSLSSDWKEGIIVKIPNKGDLSNCSNWRGITLLATLSKIFNRIMELLEKKIRMKQAGFRPNWSCVTLRVITEQSLEFQSPLFLLFVEYSRAFDSVQRRCICRALK